MKLGYGPVREWLPIRELSLPWGGIGLKKGKDLIQPLVVQIDEKKEGEEEEEEEEEQQQQQQQVLIYLSQRDLIQSFIRESMCGRRGFQLVV